MSADPFAGVVLPTPAVTTVTEYTWPQGYCPSVVEDYARTGDSGHRIVTRFTVYEGDDGDRRTELQGRRVTLDGRIIGREHLILALAFEAEMQRRHVAATSSDEDRAEHLAGCSVCHVGLVACPEADALGIEFDLPADR